MLHEGNTRSDRLRQTFPSLGAYVDVWRKLHPDDPGFTFPIWDPHLRLDYAFTPERDVPRILSCEIACEPRVVLSASDHYPILLTLTGF